MELETGAWSFWRTEERRRVRHGWPPEDSGWTFQAGGAAGWLCARGPGVFSEKGAGWLRAGRRHDSDGGRSGAGADSAEGRAREPAAARRAQHFKFSSGREVAREPGCGGAGRLEPAREGLGRGAVRGHYLGWKCRPAGEASAERGGAGSLADALP